jgi:hypothetical protein
LFLLTLLVCAFREEYDPYSFSRGKDCVLYLTNTDFSQTQAYTGVLPKMLEIIKN